MCDALGNMVDFVLLPGQRHDTVGVADLISDWEFEGFIADTAFDADWITAELEQRGSEIVIAQHPNRNEPRKIDKALYKWRHLVENWHWETEGIQTRRHACLQNRHKLQCHDLRGRCRVEFPMNLNSP